MPISDGCCVSIVELRRVTQTVRTDDLGPSLAAHRSRMDLFRRAAAVCLGFAVSGCAVLVRTPHPPTEGGRLAAMAHAQLWAPTEVRSMDLRRGPGGNGAFTPGEQVTCDYIDVKLSGHSP